MEVRLRPVQRDMLALLSDGEPHTIQELADLLWDDRGPQSNVHPHLTAIRRWLQTQGQVLLFLRQGEHVTYQLRRHMVSGDAE